ncbi:Fibroblast growth factor-binding 1 [Sigmodon hispidus]
MRIHSLLLFFLLLASRALADKVRKQAKNAPQNVTVEGTSTLLGKAQNNQRNRTSKSTTNGKFVTKDQATCKWAVTEEVVGVSLKVQCTKADHDFSCVFAGDPTDCLKQNNDQIYWKQIARTLRKQKNICGNPESVLKSRVCKKKFPESNLKLVNANAGGKTKPSKEKAAVPTTEYSKVQDASSVEPDKVKEGTAPSSNVTQTMTIKDLECLEDPDVLNQRKIALEFCGESWSSLCKFFLNMLQSTSC